MTLDFKDRTGGLRVEVTLPRRVVQGSKVAHVLYLPTGFDGNWHPEAVCHGPERSRLRSSWDSRPATGDDPTCRNCLRGLASWVDGVPRGIG